MRVQKHAPLDALLELEQEALVVLVGDAHEALQQRPALGRAEAEHVHHLVRARLATLAAGAEREDGAADAVAGGQPLERGPPQGLLVVLVPPPRGGAREGVRRAPPRRGPGPGAAVQAHARHLLDLRRRVHARRGATPARQLAPQRSRREPPRDSCGFAASLQVCFAGCEGAVLSRGGWGERRRERVGFCRRREREGGAAGASGVAYCVGLRCRGERDGHKPWAGWRGRRLLW
jgi:hypothetical protein